MLSYAADARLAVNVLLTKPADCTYAHEQRGDTAKASGMGLAQESPEKFFRSLIHMDFSALPL